MQSWDSNAKKRKVRKVKLNISGISCKYRGHFYDVPCTCGRTRQVREIKKSFEKLFIFRAHRMQEAMVKKIKKIRKKVVLGHPKGRGEVIFSEYTIKMNGYYSFIGINTTCAYFDITFTSRTSR